MQELAQRVARYIREQRLLRAGDRVAVAVSGGADSVALLRLLLELRDELGLVLSVAHVNHRIRGAEADADQEFVATLAKQHGLELHVCSADTPAYAAQHRLSLEAAARDIRYDYFRRLILDGQVNKVATAHSLDDQAETVLLRLARGTGISGLAGVYPLWPVQAASSPHSAAATRAIVRPLLQTRRRELENYLRGLGQRWREDASNLDLGFARNRVRHKILPLLESELNARIGELLAETADIARAEEEYWSAELAKLLPQAWTVGDGATGGVLRIDSIRSSPVALQRRLMRAAAESLGLKLEFIQVEQLLRLAEAPPAGEKEVVLPEGWRALRSRAELKFEKTVQQGEGSDYDYSLSIPGEVVVPETRTLLRAMQVVAASAPAGELYDTSRLPERVRVRNWRPGDHFWPIHTKAPKKIKELLQERKVPLAERRTWPVIVSLSQGGKEEEEIIWVRGFPPAQRWLAAAGQADGVLIQEFPLQQKRNHAE